MNLDFKITGNFLFGKLTFQELNSLMKWCKTSSENELLFSKMLKVRVLRKYTDFNSSDNIEIALQKLNKKIAQRNTWRKFRYVYKYAAIYIVFFSAGFSLWNRYITPEKYISIVVEKDENVKKILLKDGTVVWLNSASSLYIPENFEKDRRLVRLEGEAYFDVKKDSLHPFLVNAGYVNLKVLGTSFNLKTDISNKQIETILVSGKVTLQNSKKQDVIRLSPGEKVTYTHDENRFFIETVDPAIQTSWYLNQMIFDNNTLREIVNKLSLMYDININIQSKKLADRKFRCVINKDETLTEVLDILTFLAPVKYKIEENEVFIIE